MAEKFQSAFCMSPFFTDEIRRASRSCLQLAICTDQIRDGVFRSTVCLGSGTASGNPTPSGRKAATVSEVTAEDTRCG
ncbi:hypothetical protein BaRGS_00013747 [Batillaria attramentaria]|uniref:Uncharacterized protein n=1 Tax=Batillaria attramentaria TaxID=370345 RepID=A0ABD0L6L8_9CAEN